MQEREEREKTEKKKKEYAEQVLFLSAETPASGAELIGRVLKRLSFHRNFTGENFLQIIPSSRPNNMISS